MRCDAMMRWDVMMWWCNDAMWWCDVRWWCNMIWCVALWCDLVMPCMLLSMDMYFYPHCTILAAIHLAAMHHPSSSSPSPSSSSLNTIIHHQDRCKRIALSDLSMTVIAVCCCWCECSWWWRWWWWWLSKLLFFSRKATLQSNASLHLQRNWNIATNLLPAYWSFAAF